MTTTAHPDLTEFLARQVELIHAGDADGLAARYAEDAEMVRFDTVAQGRAEIRDLLAAYMARSPQVLGQPSAVVTGDLILYRSLLLLDGRDTLSVGTLVFRDGLVWRQTAAFLDIGPRESGA